MLGKGPGHAAMNARPAYHPYQPPGHAPPPNHGAPYGSAGEPGPAAWTKWVYLATGTVNILGIGAAVTIIALSGGFGGDEVLAAIGVAILCISLALFTVKFILRLVWLHASWSWVPPEYRYTAGNKAVSPGTAVGFLFIPYFNLYWMFVANVGLCGALERLVQRHRTVAQPPTTLATLACIAELLPAFNLCVAPFLWFLVMKGFDDVTREVDESRLRERANPGNASYSPGYAQQYVPVAPAYGPRY